MCSCVECGRTYQENSASFSSPAVLEGGGVRCEWRIMATHGEKILLNITELDLYKSESCRTDYLEIRDGYWHKSPVIGKQRTNMGTWAVAAPQTTQTAVMIC